MNFFFFFECFHTEIMFAYELTCFCLSLWRKFILIISRVMVEYTWVVPLVDKPCRCGAQGQHGQCHAGSCLRLLVPVKGNFINTACNDIRDIYVLLVLWHHIGEEPDIQWVLWPGVFWPYAIIQVYHYNCCMYCNVNLIFKLYIITYNRCFKINPALNQILLYFHCIILL